MPVHYRAENNVADQNPVMVTSLAMFSLIQQVHTPLSLETKIFYRGEYMKTALRQKPCFLFRAPKIRKGYTRLTKLNVAPDVVSKIGATGRKRRQPRADP